jgi:hypothetical protein
MFLSFPYLYYNCLLSPVVGFIDRSLVLTVLCSSGWGLFALGLRVPALLRGTVNNNELAS